MAVSVAIEALPNEPHRLTITSLDEAIRRSVRDDFQRRRCPALMPELGA